MALKKSVLERAAEIDLKALGDCDDAAVEAIRVIRNEPSVRENMYTCHEIGEAEHRTWFEAMKANDRSVFYAVSWQGELVGGAGFSQIDRTNRRADWAFYLHPSVHGKGVGSALEFRMLDLAFDQFAFEKLNCEVLDFNGAVIELHKRFGFVEEGRRRRHIVRSGVPHDAVLLGITTHEWQIRRNEMTATAKGGQ